MSNQKIIYPTSSGSVAVVVPADGMPVFEVALKDVPAGVPFRIVSADVVPSAEGRAGWSPGFDEPDGHGIGHDAWAASSAQE